MRLEHQIKNVVNEKYTETPGEKGGHQEHPISKKTSDYEEKHFHAASGKDDRNTFITGKKPEHPEDVEDKAHKTGKSNKVKGQDGGEGNINAQEEQEQEDLKTRMKDAKKGKKFDPFNTKAADDVEEQELEEMNAKFDMGKMKKLAQKDGFIAMAMKKDKPQSVFNTYVAQNKVLLNVYNEESEMNIDLKQVENISEAKKSAKDEESFMGAIAHAASQGKDSVKIGGKTHPVTMKKSTHKSIKKNKGEDEQVKENMTFEEAVRAAQEKGAVNAQKYWEEAAKEKQEGWGGKGGVAGKGSVTTVRPKKNGGMTIGGK